MKRVRSVCLEKRVVCNKFEALLTLIDSRWRSGTTSGRLKRCR
jgi:hypothetical protein